VEDHGSLRLFREVFTRALESLWREVPGSCEALVQYLNPARLSKQTDSAFPGHGPRTRSLCEAIKIINNVCRDTYDDKLPRRFIGAGFLEIVMTFTDTFLKERAVKAVMRLLKSETSREFADCPVFECLLSLADTLGAHHPAYLYSVAEFTNAVAWYCPRPSVFISHGSMPLPLHLLAIGLTERFSTSTVTLLAVAQTFAAPEWTFWALHSPTVKSSLRYCLRSLLRLPKGLQPEKPGAVCAVGFALANIGRFENNNMLLDANTTLGIVGASLTLWKPGKQEPNTYVLKCLLAGIINASLRVKEFASKFRSSREIPGKLASIAGTFANVDRDVAEFWYWAAFNLEKRAPGAFQSVIWSPRLCTVTLMICYSDKRVLHRMFRFFGLVARNEEEPPANAVQNLDALTLQSLVQGCAADPAFVDVMVRAIPRMFPGARASELDEAWSG
jgi:hypothetical protein